MSEKNRSSTKTVDIEKTLPEQIDKLIPIWSEANKELEKLLSNVIKDGIQTVGCCSGHNKEIDNGRLPYLAFKCNRDSKKEEIIDFLAKLDGMVGKVFIVIGKRKDEGSVCSICSPEKGRDNGDFFRMINLLYSSKEKAVQEIRVKYEALVALMLDDRTSEGYRRVYYCPGDTKVEVLGFKGLKEHKTAYVDIKLLLEKFEFLKRNPEASVSNIFGKNETTSKIYPMGFIKDFAEKSKQTLEKIKEWYRRIKDAYAEKDNIIQEGGKAARE